MKIALPPDVVEKLPAPASDDGLVRVTVGLKVESDGSTRLVEVNDTPIPDGEDDDEETPADDSDTAEYSADALKQLSEI